MTNKAYNKTQEIMKSAENLAILNNTLNWSDIPSMNISSDSFDIKINNNIVIIIFDDSLLSKIVVFFN